MADNILSSKSRKTHILVECAVMIALATVLSLIEIYKAPLGGAVTLLSMAPIIVLSMRHGVRAGLAGAFVYSILQLILGLGNVAWVPTAGGIILCILFDYFIPFTVLGLGGMFRNVGFTKNKVLNLIIASVLGTLIVTLIRFLCHIVSGAVIWYALDLIWYADDPTHIVHRYSAWMFSVIYNGIFMIPEMIETVIGVPLLTSALVKFKIK